MKGSISSRDCREDDRSEDGDEAEEIAGVPPADESDEIDATYGARTGKYVTCAIVTRDHMGTCTP